MSRFPVDRHLGLLCLCPLIDCCHCEDTDEGDRWRLTPDVLGCGSGIHVHSGSPVSGYTQPWEPGDEFPSPRIALMIVSYPSVKHDPEAGASYATLARGKIARTVEATESINVDVDVDGKVLGIEVIGEGNWVDGLAALAMTGRLRVIPAP
jgi:uncharacterized protein YuzE